MSIANEHADTLYLAHFDFKDPVNATFIITFWVQWTCIFFVLDVVLQFLKLVVSLDIISFDLWSFESYFIFFEDGIF